MVGDNDQNVIGLDCKSILWLPVMNVQHQLSTTSFSRAHHVVADHPNRSYFRGDSEVSRGFTRRKHFERADVACMIKANEGVLHSSSKSFSYMVLTDPLIVYRRVVAFTKL